MSNQTNPKALSGIYLDAVLPAMVELSHIDEITQSILNETKSGLLQKLRQFAVTRKNQDFTVSIGILGGKTQALTFKKDRIELHNNSTCRDLFSASTPKDHLKLVFLNHSHLNLFFSGKKWLPPLPIKGFTKLSKLKTFIKIGNRLDILLKNKQSESSIFTRLSFIIAGLSLLPLAQYDTIAKQILKKLPTGIAHFKIGKESKPVQFWFENHSNAHKSGLGEPLVRPTVSIEFSDITIANKVIRNDIDTLAAIGTNRIKLSGLAPLADGLGIIMERLTVYLP